MDLTQFRATVTQSAPPEGMSLALQTLWWDAKGDWDRAHQCAQQDEGTTGSIVDQATRRRDRLLDRPVVGRKGGEAATVDDLEVEQSSRQTCDGDDHGEGKDEEAGEIPNWARTFVVERTHQSSRSDSVRRSWIEIASGPIKAARIVS